MAKAGIIFDMDGTLWDSAEGVAISWTEIVNKEHDKDRIITTEDIQGVMGRTMDKIAEAIALVIKGGEEKVAEAKAIVDALTAKYPLI